MKRITILLFFLITSSVLISQDKARDVIRLKNGYSLSGNIHEFVVDEYVILEVRSGTMINLPLDIIRTIEQKGESKSVKPYAFKEQGIYHATTAAMSFNRTGAYSLLHSIGYRQNRFLGFGIGAGLENFEDGEGKRFIPIFAEIRGYLSAQKISPYYNLKIGSGIGLKNEDFNIEETKGGIHINPEIGYRLGGGDAVNVFIGVGMKIQHGSFTYVYPWNETTVVENLKYRRYMVNLGIVF